MDLHGYDTYVARVYLRNVADPVTVEGLDKKSVEVLEGLVGSDAGATVVTQDGGRFTTRGDVLLGVKITRELR